MTCPKCDIEPGPRVFADGPCRLLAGGFSNSGTCACGYVLVLEDGFGTRVFLGKQKVRWVDGPHWPPRLHGDPKKPVLPPSEWRKADYEERGLIRTTRGLMLART